MDRKEILTSIFIIKHKMNHTQKLLSNFAGVIAAIVAEGVLLLSVLVSSNEELLPGLFEYLASFIF